MKNTTTVEWGYKLFSMGMTTKKLVVASKALAPQQVLHEIAKCTLVPLTRKLDKVLGLEKDKFDVLGYQVPCSFSTAGILVIEGLAITVSPVQWVAYKAVDLATHSIAEKVNMKLKLHNKGKIGQEVASLITLTTNFIGRKSVEKARKK